MTDTYGIIAKTYNLVKNGLNGYLSERNAATITPGLRVGLIDQFHNDGQKLVEGKRSLAIDSVGDGVYQADWETTVISIGFDLLLLDTDTRLIHKYKDHLINFLNGLQVGITRLVANVDVQKKQYGSEHERLLVVLEIIIDTMEDDDE